jgi:hypothetical protein
MRLINRIRNRQRIDISMIDREKRFPRYGIIADQRMRGYEAEAKGTNNSPCREALRSGVSLTKNRQCTIREGTASSTNTPHFRLYSLRWQPRAMRKISKLSYQIQVHCGWEWEKICCYWWFVLRLTYRFSPTGRIIYQYSSTIEPMLVDST